jgi:Flp pilus assembly protein CpaB
MEASSIRKKIGGGRPGGDMLSTRNGALAVAALAALLAGVLIYAFVQRYKTHQAGTTAATPVFVATGFIPRGTSADAIASSQLLQRTSVKGSQVQAGAIADPSVLHGEVTTASIYPGEQLTVSDFTHGSVSAASQLTGNQRAIYVPEDTAHGLVGVVHGGDHVDVLGVVGTVGLATGHGGVTTLAQNVLVLNAPSTPGSGIGGGNNSQVLLRVDEQQAQEIAFAADSSGGKVWLILRPPLDTNAGG